MSVRAYDFQNWKFLRWIERGRKRVSSVKIVYILSKNWHWEGKEAAEIEDKQK